MTGHRLIPFEGDLEPGEDYEGLRFAAATFDDAAAGGCHFLDCSFVSTSFSGGRLRKSRFTDVTFEDCMLRDLDFGGATLLRVSFAGCILTGADFTKAACTEVDLRGAQLGITAGYESLRGVTIDSVQLVALAPYLARHLGITVAD